MTVVKIESCSDIAISVIVEEYMEILNSESAPNELLELLESFKTVLLYFGVSDPEELYKSQI